MSTYEQIEIANKQMRKTKIKSKLGDKEYAEVSERIKAFRMVYPNGTITTEIISLVDGIVTMKSTILNEEGKVIATGYAEEDKKSSYINNTSYIENCETSAVGRALGMCGLGVDVAVASKDEIDLAKIRQQEELAKKNKTKDQSAGEQPRLATEDDITRIWSIADKAAIKRNAILKSVFNSYRKGSLEDLTHDQAAEVMIKLSTTAQKKQQEITNMI